MVLELTDILRLKTYFFDKSNVLQARKNGAGLKAGMGPEWNSETQKTTNISTITQYFFIR